MRKIKENQIMRKRTYTLAAVTLLMAATIAGGRATPLAALIDAEVIELTTAGSKGDKSTAGSESSVASSMGDRALGRESS
jgi:hypothetical protein